MSARHVSRTNHALRPCRTPGLASSSRTELRASHVICSAARATGCTKRDLLAAALLLAPCVAPRHATADEQPPPAESSSGPKALLNKVLAPRPPEKDPVLPATKTVKEYIQDIYKARPKAWQQIAQRIQKAEYYTLSSDLLLSPFDDLRQACFFIPWALLNNEEVTASSDARKAYDDLMDHVDDLDRISRAAASGEATAEKVQQAFFLLNATLDKFISTIPRKYFA